MGFSCLPSLSIIEISEVLGAITMRSLGNGIIVPADVTSPGARTASMVSVTSLMESSLIVMKKGRDLVSKVLVNRN